MRRYIFDVGGVMVDGFDVAPDIAARLGLTVSELRPRMYDLVRRLREAGERVVAGTNTLDAHYRIHTELGDYDAFAHTYASHLIHLAKPDPAFYRHILDAEGVTPAQALFIDDFEANVHAAAGLGIHTILYQAEDDAIAQVEGWVGAGLR